MTVELTNEELKVIYDTLNYYMVENDSLNADIIIDIMDKIEEII